MAEQDNGVTLREIWVLLVDDEKETLDVLAEGLKLAGFNVAVAAQVEEANAKLAERRFDCVITDLFLGEGNGAQVITALRTGSGINAKVPIMLMSAALQRDVLQRIAPLINGVLVKPFQIPTLVSRVGELTTHS